MQLKLAVKVYKKVQVMSIERKHAFQFLNILTILQQTGKLARVFILAQNFRLGKDAARLGGERFLFFGIRRRRHQTFKA